MGTFDRLHLARLVLGAEAIGESMLQASAVLGQWGYRGVLIGKHRLRGGLSQALLINRSPRLEDLNTAVEVSCQRATQLAQQSVVPSMTA
ncbi:hypothetical protein [Rhodococcus jostii]|uniref:hypothetical protein n=1 Tax=Rhodococcus jostii TaxID=132919 RepID=UPI0002E0FE0E|nr:hypothetical protein [Rhodococcus jostii]